MKLNNFHASNGQESEFDEAHFEAERILRWRRTDIHALFVKAEALYAKCKVMYIWKNKRRMNSRFCFFEMLQFEHALRTYHAGCRSRAPLYSDAFR